MIEHPSLESEPDRGPERLPEIMPLPASWSLRTGRKEKKGAMVSAASQSSSDQIAVSIPHYRLDQDKNAFPLRRQPMSRGSRGTCRSGLQKVVGMAYLGCQGREQFVGQVGPVDLGLRRWDLVCCGNE